jgi:hypothetical protein
MSGELVAEGAGLGALPTHREAAAVLVLVTFQASSGSSFGPKTRSSLD